VWVVVVEMMKYVVVNVVMKVEVDVAKIVVLCKEVKVSYWSVDVNSVKMIEVR
jgi:hypothetical protein